ncbi:hypothetical protein GGI42DRAFT_130789 [Trichoderma sp. SZMC 28013]
MPGLGICSFLTMHTDPKTVTVGLSLLASVVELTNGRHDSYGSWWLMALMALPMRSCQRSKPLPLAKAVSGSCCTHSNSSALPEWSHRKSNYGTSQNVECQHGSRRDDRRLTTVVGRWRHTVSHALICTHLSGGSTTEGKPEVERTNHLPINGEKDAETDRPAHAHVRV